MQQSSLIKLIIGVIALIIVIAGVMMVFAPEETKPVPRAPTQDEMKALAVDIAAQIDGDAFAALKPGDETTPAFLALYDRLNAIRTQNPDILFVYTMRKVGNATEYVVDADYGAEYGAPIGEVYYPSEDVDAAFLAGFEAPSAEPYYIWKRGEIVYTVTTGYAPVKDSTGAVVGLVVVEIGRVITDESLKTLAAGIASRIDSDAFAALKPGDESTPAFAAIRDELNAARASNPGVLYVYTLRQVGNTTEYVVDADYGIGDGAAIGRVYRPTEGGAAYLAGFEAPSAETEMYLAEWEGAAFTAVSGYAPIKDSTGAVVGLVGVDIGHNV